MSTDTIAIFEVPDGHAALETIRRFATTTTPSPLSAVGQRYLERWRPQEWEYDGHDNLLGPGGFSIRAEGGIVEVYHLLRYQTFAVQGEDGRLVLDAFHFIGRLIGSNAMIIIHELLPHEGQNLNAASETLRDRIGPPATDWKELHSSDLYEAGCWIRVEIEREAE